MYNYARLNLYTYGKIKCSAPSDMAAHSKAGRLEPPSIQDVVFGPSPGTRKDLDRLLLFAVSIRKVFPSQPPCREAHQSHASCVTRPKLSSRAVHHAHHFPHLLSGSEAHKGFSFCQRNSETYIFTPLFCSSYAAFPFFYLVLKLAMSCFFSNSKLSFRSMLSRFLSDFRVRWKRCSCCPLPALL